MGVLLASARAQQDLRAILAHLATLNPASALRIFDQIHECCQMLADNPRLGRRRPELQGRNTRIWPGLRPYLILYRPVRGGVRIIRVIDGRWDLRQLAQRKKA